MGKVAAFHSTTPETPSVYHDNDECSAGKNIKSENRASGTDNRKKCEICKGL